MNLLMLFRVSGHSMEPTFKPGQTVLVSSIPYIFTEPKVSDVVVIKDPQDGKPLLKRIIRIDNYSSSDPPAGGESRSLRQDSSRQARTIREDQYFVAGDNRRDSIDSRTFGEITKATIVGKVILKTLTRTLNSREY